MGKAKMYGAYTPYSPNSKADLRYRRKAMEKKIADRTPKEKGRIANERTRCS